MAITYGTPTTHYDSGTSVASLTKSHTVGASASALVVVVQNGTTSQSAGDVTWNSTNLTFLIASNAGGGSTEMEIWILESPTAGTGNVVVTFSGTEDRCGLLAVDVIGSNGHSTTSMAASSGSSSTPSCAITTDTNGSDAFGAWDQGNTSDTPVSYTPDSGVTELQDTDNGGGSAVHSFFVGYRTVATAGSSSVGATRSPATARSWSGAAIELYVATGGVSATATQATETDTARPVTAVKPYPVTQATSTETATALTSVLTRALGQASETDTAQQMFAKLVSPWTTPIEITTIAGVDRALETDSARVVVDVRGQILTIATESDTARVVSVAEITITAPAFYRFYRISGQLVLGPVGRSTQIGYKSAEGYEVVSSVIRCDQLEGAAGSPENAMAVVSPAWAANSGAAAATLQTAIHTNLQASGFRDQYGAALT